jgi:hypothetical protein
MPGPAIGQIVAGHTGDHDMPEFESRGRLGQATRFIGIHDTGLTGLHRTKAAVPRAHIAQDHKRGHPPAETFMLIGAVRPLTDGMQRLSLEQLIDGALRSPAGIADPNPGRQSGPFLFQGFM